MGIVAARGVVVMSLLVLFNKPFRVISQFSPAGDKETLAQYIDIPGVYAAGRLDYDSEGLMLLTDDGRLQQRLSNPRHHHYKTYWVQVDGDIDQPALSRLQQGVDIKHGRTLPARVKKIDEPASLWPRNPPIRYRAQLPTSWIELSIREGKNRQVRHMTAAVGYPTLRLVRVKIDKWSLRDLQPGSYQVIRVKE